MAVLLTGKPVADALSADTRARAEALLSKGVQPRLVLLRCGDNEADGAYIRGAVKRAALCGVAAELRTLPADASADVVAAAIDAVNRDPAVHGCLLLRPSREMQFDDPENPTILEDFIRAIGAEPVYYGMRNECCGGYTTIENRACASKQAQKIADSAKAQGAELLITACPLCLYNLSQNTDGTLPVRYFTELLAEALGVGEDAE